MKSVPIKFQTVEFDKLEGQDLKTLFSKVRERGTFLIQNGDEELCVLMDPEQFELLQSVIEEYQQNIRRYGRGFVRAPFTWKNAMEAMGVPRVEIDEIDTSLEELMKGK